MLNYSTNITLRKPGYLGARKPLMTDMKEDHQNLRHRTLVFFGNKIFDEHEFNRLEQLIKKSIYHTATPCYANANLLDLLYNRRLIESLSTPKTRFGATLSHGLKPEEGTILGIRPSIDLPDVIVNGWMIDKKRIKISPLLYNGNLYKIEFDPFIGNAQYEYEMYDNVVKNYYDEHERLFEQKNIFVHPDAFFYDDQHSEFFKQNRLHTLKERIDSLRTKKSGFLIYLGTCCYLKHLVAFILTVKKTTPKMSARCYYLDMNNFQRGADLNKITSDISTVIGIPIEHQELYPKVYLNISGKNMFEYIGYCGVIAHIFINFLLQFLLQCNTMKEHSSMSRILKKVYKTCVSMKKIKTVYGRDLWYYVVKNCTAAMYLKNYNLDGTKPLNEQSFRNIDIWSDSLFPENYFDVANMIRVSNSESEYRRKNFVFDPLYKEPAFKLNSEDQLNKNCLKLSYAVAHFGCVETMFGIVLYENNDTTSLTDTLSSAVNDNRVDYYVIDRLHYSAMFGTDNERNLTYYGWLKYVTELKMVIRFAPMSGNFEEILTLTKDGIIKQNKTYTRFHIFGLKKNSCLDNLKIPESYLL